MGDRSPVAAIDMGSNGIRLAIGRRNDDDQIDIVHYERAGVRLGADAFSIGRLQPLTLVRVVDTMRSFKESMERFEVKSYRAVATSAAREIDNSNDLVLAVKDRTDLDLEIIGGLEEAQLMFFAIAPRFDLEKKSALLIDMGGGSVELTVAWDTRAEGAETLPLGPVRLIHDLKRRGWAEMDVSELLNRHATAVERFVDTELANHAPADVAFGAGGNIEALAQLRVRLLNKKRSHKIKLDDLESMLPTLLAMSVEERMERFSFRADRADVIAIAAMVLHMMMDQTNVKRILVPKLGIKDGILNRLSGIGSSP